MTGLNPRLVCSDKEMKLSKQGEEYMFILSRRRVDRGREPVAVYPSGVPTINELVNLLEKSH